MDPRCAVAEYLCHDREEFRRGIRGMEKSVDYSNAREGDFVMLRRADHGNETCLRLEFLVEVVGLKRKRHDFRMDCGRLDLEDELIVAPLQARSIVVEQTLPSAAGGNNIVLTQDGDYDVEDDCVIVGCRMPESTLPGPPAESNVVLTHESNSDDDDCVIVGCRMTQSTPTGAQAGCNVALTHDSDVDLDDGEDDDCVIVGCLMPPVVVISNSCSNDELIASVAGDNFSALESDDEISAPIWDAENDIS